MQAKIKICGLSRPCDIDYVNEARPDFIGFVINFPKSRRSITPRQTRTLREGLAEGITPVGVFVDAPPQLVAGLLNDGTIRLAQLHGNEDERYIRRLRGLTDGRLTKAFTVAGAGDVARAKESSADYILLDNGTGTGRQFDWELLGEIGRPWFLAGGLTPDNLAQAVRRFTPWAVDLSSGAETDGYKDREKILAAVRAVRAVSFEKEKNEETGL